jgi:hypothetical protein
MDPTASAPCVGIDVSKAQLAVAVDDEPVFTVAHTPEGHAAHAPNLMVGPTEPSRFLVSLPSAR